MHYISYSADMDVGKTQNLPQGLTAKRDMEGNGVNET